MSLLPVVVVVIVFLPTELLIWLDNYCQINGNYQMVLGRLLNWNLYQLHSTTKLKFGEFSFHVVQLFFYLLEKRPCVLHVAANDFLLS